MKTIQRLAENAPARLVHQTKSLLYSRLPYGISQVLDRTARPEAVAQARHLATSARAFEAIFIHVPKVAGISVRRSLFGDEHFGTHHPIRDYMMVLPRDEFERFFKFCFVRNPWDRTYSAYSFLARGGINEQDQAWADRHLEGVGSFRQFVLERLPSEGVRKSLHFLPQTHWVCSPSGRVMMDMVGRYERLGEDFKRVCARLGIDAELDWSNKTAEKSAGYRQVYDPEMAKVVGSVYAHDVEAFSYSF